MIQSLSAERLGARRLLPRIVRRAVAGAAVVVAFPAIAVAQDSTAASAAGKSTVKGVYTDDQASRGESAYKTYCVNCHSAKQYTGDAFKVSWVSRTAYDIYFAIATEMPEDDPGALAKQDYVDIVAYLFRLNGYPAGSAELPADDGGLKTVKIEAMANGTATPPPPAHESWSARQIRLHPIR